MKRIAYIVLALAVLVGCDKEKTFDEMSFKEKISGEWNCTVDEIKADIHISFAGDGKFELYQKITDGKHRLYRGTWFVKDEKQKVISGKYNDGEDWASDYVVSFANEKNMTLSPTEVSSSLEYKYVRKAIPAEVKKNCEVIVKSPYAY